MSCSQLNRQYIKSALEFKNVPLDTSESIKIAFLNFRAETPTHKEKLDGENLRHPLWEKRMKPITQLIQYDTPDILGFCELTHEQLTSLLEKIRNTYEIFGVRSNKRTEFESEKKIESSGIEEDNKKEYIGALIKKQKASFKNKESFSNNDKDKKEKYSRVLVKLQVLIKLGIQEKELYVFVSHFHDKGGADLRKKSGDFELNKIKEVEKDKPWVSLGDRNWYPDEDGQKLYEQYTSEKYVCDFRDETEHEHYGPLGTFRGT